MKNNEETGIQCIAYTLHGFINYAGNSVWSRSGKCGS